MDCFNKFLFRNNQQNGALKKILRIKEQMGCSLPFKRVLSHLGIALSRFGSLSPIWALLFPFKLTRFYSKLPVTKKIAVL